VAREIVVLVNPTSGRGRGARLAEPVTDRLREAGLDARWEAGRDAAEAADMARRAVARGVDGLVIVGGDGMVRLALDAVAQTSTPLGVIPAGTGNDLARAIGIPVRDPLAAADIVVAGFTRSHDLGRTPDGWFATVLCAGFDSRVAERMQTMTWPRGRMRYDVAVLAELGRFRTQHFVLDLDGEEEHANALLVAVGVTRSYGGGLRICEAADPTDGMLDVTVVGAIRRRELVWMFPKLSKGTHVGHPALTTYRAKKVTLSSDDVTAYADGEPVAPLPLTVECVPGALQVFAPPPPETR
jgi:diacylglycerol kinase (ATP)